MKILLANDDGILAEGINALYKVLSKEHEVYISAPHEEQSGKSNAFTVNKALPYRQVAADKIAVHGFPADCVNLIVHGEIFPKPDLVISGINHGPNMGVDVFFSGTVAAARTAYINKVSALAVSVDTFDEPKHLSDIAKAISILIKENQNVILKDKIFWNINFPDSSYEKFKGIRYTKLGDRRYLDAYKKVSEKDDLIYMQMTGKATSTDICGTDLTETKNGYITITPLTLDTTDYHFLNKEKNIE